MGDGDPLDIRRGFFELGLDSLMSVELRKKLQSVTGLTLPGTITLNYSNVVALAKYLNGRLSAAAAGAPAPAQEPTILPPSSLAEDEVIAVLSDDEAHAILAAELCALNGDSMEQVMPPCH
jgi:acyl carrier protein